MANVQMANANVLLYSEPVQAFFLLHSFPFFNLMKEKVLVIYANWTPLN